MQEKLVSVLNQAHAGAKDPRAYASWWYDVQQLLCEVLRRETLGKSAAALLVRPQPIARSASSSVSNCVSASLLRGRACVL